MQFAGRRVTDRELSLIREVVSSCTGLSRMELAHTVCELLGWKRPTGLLKGRECREFLEHLAESGMLVLPDKQAGRPVGKATVVPITERGAAGEMVRGRAGELGELRLERVQAEDERQLFRELLGRYHYLGHAVPYGAQLRYLVYGSRPERRLLGCLQFSSPAWRIRARDRWIGWNDASRVRNLQHVVNNSRFLLLPWVEVKNLASRLLSQAVRQMAADWHEHYAVEPWLAETLVDGTRYSGTCYRAANWAEVGTTEGYARRYRQHRRVAVQPKKVFLYPLVPDAAQRLRGEQT